MTTNSESPNECASGRLREGECCDLAKYDLLNLIEQLLIERCYFGDSYGVHGSDFDVCVCCGAENGAGVLRHPFVHADDCHVARIERELVQLRTADYAAQAERIAQLERENAYVKEQLDEWKKEAMLDIETIKQLRADRDTELAAANRVTERCMQLICDLAASDQQTNSGLQLRKRANAIIAARTQEK